MHTDTMHTSRLLLQYLYTQNSQKQPACSSSEQPHLGEKIYTSSVLNLFLPLFDFFNTDFDYSYYSNNLYKYEKVKIILKSILYNKLNHIKNRYTSNFVNKIKKLSGQSWDRKRKTPCDSEWK